MLDGVVGPWVAPPSQLLPGRSKRVGPAGANQRLPPLFGSYHGLALGNLLVCPYCFQKFLNTKRTSFRLPQVEVMAARLSQAEADAAVAREAAAAAHSAASKAEADLADLSGAYNNLEAHAFATEAQLRSVQSALSAAEAAEARAQAVAGVLWIGLWVELTCDTKGEFSEASWGMKYVGPDEGGREAYRAYIVASLLLALMDCQMQAMIVRHRQVYVCVMGRFASRSG